MDTLLSNKVYNQLYAAMLDHRLRPGDRLNRRQVAQDLGVSVAPVLEAMMQLEWEGFLATSPRVGTVVRAVTATDVLGKFRLRQAIEAEAARVYAGERIRGVRPQIEKLAALADAAASGTLANYRTEVALHTALVAIAGCHGLSEAFAHVMRHSLYHAAHDLLPAVPERSPRMHMKLVAALCRADGDQGERLIRDHLCVWIDALTAESAHDLPTSDSRSEVSRGSAVRILPPGRSRRTATRSRRSS